MNKYKDLSILKNMKSVCLIGHIEPDTDAYASMLVFKNFLKSNFNINTIDLFADAKSITEYYKPLLGDAKINPKVKNYDAVIRMDAPNAERLGKFRDLYLQTKLKLVIDHHATNNFDGNINVVEFVSSTCEIVYNILKEYNYKLSRSEKEMIYAGIITDTNNLTVGNFSSKTLTIVADMLDDIDHTAIYNHFLANNSFKHMQALAIAINNANFDPNDKKLITYISPSQAKDINLQLEDIQGIANHLATTRGSLMTCLIEPRENAFYVSMRSCYGFDVGKIAKKYGGGGHTGAAAFIAQNPLTKLNM